MADPQNYEEVVKTKAEEGFARFDDDRKGLLGRFQHVPECLAHRIKDSGKNNSDRTELFRRYHPIRYRELSAPASRLFKSLLSIIRAAPLTRRSRRLGSGTRPSGVRSFPAAG